FTIQWHKAFFAAQSQRDNLLPHDMPFRSMIEMAGYPRHFLPKRRPMVSSTTKALFPETFNPLTALAAICS
ncbi:hypothetical protein, partial [Thiolapillus sp.]|uniref:hypothetical protein n=1 Tax=Thiolapillus sp. TaxID=2017437 RepID=UPI003AF680FA